MKIDAFNSCENENGKLPEILCAFIFCVSFQEYRSQHVIWDKNMDWGAASLPKRDPIKAELLQYKTSLVGLYW